MQTQIYFTYFTIEGGMNAPSSLTLMYDTLDRKSPFTGKNR